MPAVVVESDQSLSRSPVWILPMVVALAFAFVGSAVFIAGRRSRRSFQGGDADDIVGLLRGAAVSPRSFEEIRALFSRRLLRLVCGRSISLAWAREKARKGVLACGSSRSELVRKAVRGGGNVLDLDHAESAAVAEVMAAINLDRWQELLDRAVGDDLTAHVEDRLAAAGEICRILVADKPGFETMILRGTALGLGSSWVVLDRDGHPWQSVHRWAGRSPARAALLLADAVVHQGGVPPNVRHGCLSRLAMDALLEAAELPRE